tara:strand:- start:320 stop:1186 length:867 start_codon:yes stop_codon:yes gene_type:complete
MSFQIITADQRLSEKKGHKIVVCGQSGVGKTTLARTLEGSRTLFVDLEAGDSAIEGHAIDVLRPQSWPECRDLACFLGGPNPSLAEDQPYSQAHYDYISSVEGDPLKVTSKYDTLFVDSITVAGRLCFSWCQQQPESKSDRTGKLDTRAAYGLHGREMMQWLTHLQHIREKNVIFVGILDETTDDYSRKQYSLQIEGSKTGRELPGIVDEVITMAILTGDNGPYRAFVCQPLNQWGYPAKDRSGRLATLEEPHLGKLIEKMSSKLSANGKPLEFVKPETQQSEGNNNV